MPNNNPQQTTPQQQIARAAEGANKAATRLGDTAEQAASTAIARVRHMRDDAQSGIEQQRAEITDRIRRLGGVLRAGGETLGTDDPLAQQLFANAGDRVEQLAEYVGNITPGELADDITSLARRSPGLFFGGSFILGLALGRFVKSSAGAAVRGSADDDETYEETSAGRPTKRGRRRADPAEASPKQEASTKQPERGQAQAARTQSTSGSHAASTGGATSGVGAPAGIPSYGAASSVTTASKPAQSSSSTPASSAPHETKPGEGSKS